jgi:phage FluMu protein Com
VPIHFRCPHCEKLLALGTRQGGTQIQCPLCARPITVPRRTEINLPTTTVMPPDLAQAWWMDAPPVAPPIPPIPAEPPSSPTAPAEGWWLTANPPSPPSESAVSTPPPLPEVVALLFALLRGSPPADKPANTKKDRAAPAPAPASPKMDTSGKPASPCPVAVKQGRETTEEALRREAARFPEVSLDRGDDRTEAQRVRLRAAAAARDGDLVDAGPLWLKERPDLAGLPLRKGDDSRLDAASAERLQGASLALRSLLFEASGGGAEVDTEKLRSLLDADGAPRDKWVQPEAVPVLQQLLMGASAPLRNVLVERLARIDGPRASAALARTALYDLHLGVREKALAALAKRPSREYQQVLRDGFSYPWPAVAGHAAEALVALGLPLGEERDRASPTAPSRKPGKDEWYVREVVRINHLRNCLLCHAPSLKESEKLRGFVPPADRPPPSPFTREYYVSRRPGSFVRADVTYLQQDFSISLPVENPGPWPAMQRYDFLVRERLATPAEVQAGQR